MAASVSFLVRAEPLSRSRRFSPGHEDIPSENVQPRLSKAARASTSIEYFSDRAELLF
jgi:hypothetical protein